MLNYVKKPYKGMLKFKHSHFIFLLILIFLGFANALPLLITGSTLSYWLTESGYTKDEIGLYALISLPFGFKLFWTPLIDQTSLPFFHQSPRKGWMFFALSGLALSLYTLSRLDPGLHPWALALCLLILIMFSSCLYIVGISYELENLRDSQYGIGSSYVIIGYRLGLLCAGSGTLYLSYLTNWSVPYLYLSILIGIAAILVLFQPEPFKSKELIEKKRHSFSKYPTIFQGFWHETIIKPCKIFFQRSDWLTIAFLLFTFKLGDHMAKTMEGPFYLYLGYNKAELAIASKLWGMLATILGAFIAGYIVKEKDPMLSMATASLIHACSLISYYILSISDKSVALLYLITFIEHITGGIAITIFIFFLWKICDKEFAAVQYALLWSLFTIKSDFVASIGGLLANATGWPTFFIIVCCVGVSTAAASFGVILRFRYKLNNLKNLCGNGS
jgi:PAT family beta-lactamase induction signal transducer AmpG